MPTRYSFGRIPDRALIKLAENVFAQAGDASATVTFSDNAQINFSAGNPDGAKDQLKIFTATTYLIQSATIVIPSAGMNINYRRGEIYRSVLNQGWAWSADSPFVDGIWVEGPNNHPVANAAKFLPIIGKAVNLAPPMAAAAGATSALDQSAALLNGMTQAVASLVEHTAQRQKELDDRLADLEIKAAERLEADKAELRATIEIERQEVERARSELDVRAAELDDRANTHARRDIKNRMIDLAEGLLSERLFQKSTWDLAIPIAMALGAATILGLIMYRELHFIDQTGTSIAAIIRDPDIVVVQKSPLISNLQSQMIYSQARVGFQGLGLAALFWFVLRFTTNRFRQVSRWERELNKFRLDTERAAFLVEGDLEAQKLNSAGLPPILLESFSRGLFSAAEGEASDHGANSMGEALSAILGQSAKVEFGPNGARAEIDRKGLSRAQKSMGREDDA